MSLTGLTNVIAQFPDIGPPDAGGHSRRIFGLLHAAKPAVAAALSGAAGCDEAAWAITAAWPVPYSSSAKALPAQRLASASDSVRRVVAQQTTSEAVRLT